MKKKILFLESRYDSFYGAQKSMLKLIQSLNPENFDCKVVTTEKGKLKTSLEQHNIIVDVIKLGKKANVFGGKTLNYSFTGKILVALQVIYYNFKLMRYIYTNKIDFIYVNDLRALLYSVLAKKFMKKKNIWYIRSDVPNSRLTEFGLIHSNNIITIADGVLRKIPQTKLEKFNRKIKKIYTGFEFDKFQFYDKDFSKKSFGLSIDKVVIGYLGSINERKGLDMLVDSFVDINKEYNNVELLIVGDVSEGHEKYWEDQLQKIENNNLTFTHIPFCDEVSKAYCAMDIFVLPSKSEGLPRVVIEAMGHQLPTIATDVGGTKEIIENDSLGILIDNEDKSNLNQAIKKLVIDKEYREKIAQQGYESVVSKFGEERFIQEVNDFFEPNKL